MNSLESQIRKHYAQRGYWKHSLAMKLSYELGSLSEAWARINFVLWVIEEKKKDNEAEIQDNWVDLITEGMKKSKYKICTLDV